MISNGISSQVCVLIVVYSFWAVSTQTTTLSNERLLINNVNYIKIKENKYKNNKLFKQENSITFSAPCSSQQIIR